MYLWWSLPALLSILGATSSSSSSSTNAVPVPGCSHLIDLSYDYAADTVTWPTQESFRITARQETPIAGQTYVAQAFAVAEHSGTHLDAPYHVHGQRWSVDQIPINHLIAPSVKVDISDRVNAGDVHAQLTTADLAKFEEQHGRIPNHAVVLVYTGWSRHFTNTTAYFGNDVSNMTEETRVHFPGIHPEAAQWLIDNRNIVGMGIDTASTDFGLSQDYPTHKILAEHNVYGLENVIIPQELPASGYTIYAFPMKIRGGSGAPCRIIACLHQVPTSHQPDETVNLYM